MISQVSAATARGSPGSIRGRGSCRCGAGRRRIGSEVARCQFHGVPAQILDQLAVQRDRSMPRLLKRLFGVPVLMVLRADQVGVSGYGACVQV